MRQGLCSAAKVIQGLGSDLFRLPLKSRNNPFVLIMRAYPKPNNSVIFDDA